MSKDLPDSIKSTVRKYLLRVVDDIMDEIEKTYQLGYASGAADEKFDKVYSTEPDKVDTRIHELEQQIEKMKNCKNCDRYCSSMFGEESDCWKNGVPTKWKLKR